MMKAKDEYLVYILGQPSFANPANLALVQQQISDEDVTIDTILSKLPLYIPLIKMNAQIGRVVLEKLREFRFRNRANISLDDLTNYLTLANMIDGANPQVRSLSILNMLFHLKNTAN